MSNGRNFDAGQLVDQLLGMRSGGGGAGNNPLGDLLGGILGGGAGGGRVSQPGDTASPSGGAPSGGLPGGISLEDLLGGILGGGGAAGRAPQPGGGSTSGGAPSGGGGGLPGGISLEDLLGGILGGGAAGGGRAPRGAGDGSLGDFAADALAGRRGQTPAQLGDFAGAPAGLTSAIAGNPDVVNAIKDYLSRNGGVLAGGAAAGSLATLVLGSKDGRKLAKNAVALGGIALVGTLAYKAYQNYQQGQQPHEAATPLPPQQALPPEHSPFHPAQADHTHFPVTLLRTMVAASLADGHIDEQERLTIGAKLSEQGAQLDEAERFLADELANPASVQDIARDVANEEQAAEVYISALLTIDADTSADRAFLARLALALKLPPDLVPHLEAAARAAKQG